MTPAEFRQSIAPRIDDQIARTRAALDGLPIEKWNEAIPNWDWTVAQILEHVHMSNRSYLAPLEVVLRNPVKGESPFKLGFLATQIIKNAGPGGNAPAPGRVVPAKGPYDDKVLERFETDLRRLQDFASQLEGVDLAKTKVKNPLIGIFNMSLYDVYELLIQHTERHVQQIERFTKAMR
jgi:hypothetical protein